MTRYGFSVGLAVAAMLSGFAIVQSAQALDEATCKKLVDCSDAGLAKAKLTADACKAKKTACLGQKADDAGDRRVNLRNEKPPINVTPPPPPTK